MAKVVAVTNMKGGTAKTSTAVNLADMLASKGERVLLIDASPQANATGYISVQKLDQEKTTYELLCGDLSAEECVLKNVLPNLSCIPANIDLAAANPELGIVDEIDILQRKIDLIRDDYDHIIIDCSGELARYTLCALYAADHYLIPIASDHLAYQSYREFLTVLEKAGGKLWDNVSRSRTILTMFDRRLRSAKGIWEKIRNDHLCRAFETTISRSVAAAEAPSFGKPLSIYSPGNRVTKEYNRLSEEYMATYPD